MFIAFALLGILLVTAPIFIIFDGPIIHGVITAVAAVSVAVVSVRIRPGEAGFLSMVIWPVAIVAAVPALWMLIQLLPLQKIGLANPIWESAAAALGRPLAGSISIDPGATLISFVRYLSAAAIAFVAAAVAVDRRRAEWVLFALMAATTLIALMVLVAGLGGFTFLYSNGGLAGDAATESAGLGVILAAAAALHIFEHGKTQRPDQVGSGFWHRSTFAACLVAVAICSLALIVGATSQVYFAVACGVATLAAAVVIRRFGLGLWGNSAIISITLFIAIAIVVLQPGDRTMSLTIVFATHASASLIAVAQRVLAEASWAVGTGAGTFAAILPIYLGLDELSTGTIAPTAAAAIAVEMGRPLLGAILIAAIALVVTLLRGALRRQRDSFYSTAGAGCVTTITLLTFGNAALFSTPVLVIAAVIIGLAIAQSRSRLI